MQGVEINKKKETEGRERGPRKSNERESVGGGGEKGKWRRIKQRGYMQGVEIDKK